MNAPDGSLPRGNQTAERALSILRNWKGHGIFALFAFPSSALIGAVLRMNFGENVLINNAVVLVFLVLVYAVKFGLEYRKQTFGHETQTEKDSSANWQALVDHHAAQTNSIQTHYENLIKSLNEGQRVLLGDQRETFTAMLTDERRISTERYDALRSEAHEARGLATEACAKLERVKARAAVAKFDLGEDV